MKHKMTIEIRVLASGASQSALAKDLRGIDSRSITDLSFHTSADYRDVRPVGLSGENVQYGIGSLDCVEELKHRLVAH